MVAIFTYGFAIAEENFKNAKITLNTLSNYENLLLLAEKSKYITSSEAEVLSKWRIDPSNWSK
jgi:orotate phosphoribosyltransferase